VQEKQTNIYSATKPLMARFALNSYLSDQHMMAPFRHGAQRSDSETSAMSLNNAVRNTQYSRLNRAEPFDSGLLFFATFFSSRKESRKKNYRFRTISIMILLANLLSLPVYAQEFSYVYIQGDKEIPFYVKMDGEMMPRYGKNYSIISQLAPGPINIELLFQQNAYPPQQFAINVPKEGFRGFLLLRKNDKFSLYDLQRRVYLQAGNTIEEDTATVKTAATVENIELPQTNPNPIPKPKSELPKPAKKQPVATAAKKLPPPPIKKQGTTGPEFIENVELKNEHTSEGNTVTTGNKNNAGTVKKDIAIPNSDCPKAISNDDLESIQKAAGNKTDKNRLKYLLSKAETGCFTTNQVRMLTKTLDTDAERYTFLKRVYSRVTDQAVFSRLESLLSSQEWKDYFKTIIQ
jgi:hypothetical protein